MQKKEGVFLELPQLYDLIKLEITSGVVVRDVFHHTSKDFHIVGQQALFHIITQEVAKDTTEILMTRIAQEGT